MGVWWDSPGPIHSQTGQSQPIKMKKKAREMLKSEEDQRMWESEGRGCQVGWRDALDWKYDFLKQEFWKMLCMAIWFFLESTSKYLNSGCTCLGRGVYRDYKHEWRQLFLCECCANINCQHLWVIWIELRLLYCYMYLYILPDIFCIGTKFRLHLKGWSRHL